MGDTIFSALWPLSNSVLEDRSVRFLPGAASGRFLSSPSRKRRSLSLSILVILLIGLVGLIGLAHSADLSDREEDGLKGPVQSVETKESLLIQTDRYDQQGRVIERVQGGRETSQSLWPLRFTYAYDQAGRRIAEVIRDAHGDLVKETRTVYDDHGNRTAELAVWGDGTFENLSLYGYDDAHRRIRALHYNAVQVINRNLYGYDEAGRLSRERFERNYHYDAAGSQVARSDRFDLGYDVVLVHDDHGRIREKVVSDLKGRKQGRSEFRYDEHGSQIEELSYDAGGHMTDRKTYAYEYDAMGNWTTETFHWWDLVGGGEALKQSHVRERSLVYY